jgi:hypothetical protein
MMTWFLNIVIFVWLVAARADVIYPVRTSDRFLAAASLKKIVAFKAPAAPSYSQLPWVGFGLIVNSFSPLHQENGYRACHLS